MKARFFSEFVGTAFLLTVIVGSGIMAENLSQGNLAVALLANSLATGAGLFVLIQSLGPISGAHFNPVVSLVEVLRGNLTKKDMALYWAAQFVGGIIGVLVAHGMFNLPLIQVSQHERAGFHLVLSEAVATFGLISVILLSGRNRGDWAPVTIAAYITSAYWFTSSTSFANPAVTFARAWTNTFCGIAPSGILPFIFAQIIGSFLGFLFLKQGTYVQIENFKIQKKKI